MVKSSLIEILKSLNAKELRMLGEYLSSPLFNTNKNIVKLYSYILKNIAKKNNELLNKKYVFRQLFLEKSYNDSFMRSLISGLNRCVENFLSFKKFSEHDFGKKKYLLESFHEKGLDRQFSKAIKASISDLEKPKGIKNRRYYYNRHILEYIFNYQSFKMPRPFLKVKEIRYDEMETESSNLAIYFIISVLKRYLYLLNEKLLYPAKFNQAFYEEIMKYVKIPPFRDIPLILFYCKFINLLNGRDIEENYWHVRKFLFENHRVFDQDEQYTHFTILANVNTTGTRAIDNEENFELFKFMLEHKISMRGEETIISSSKFTAISIVAASLRKTEWLFWFIDNFKRKLPEKERENTVNYCLSLQYYQLGDYEKTLFYLNKVRQDRLYSKLRVKSLYIRVYYELGLFQESLDQIDSFRHFISSTRLLTKDFRKSYGTFIKFMRRLIKIKTGTAREKLDDFKYDVSKSGAFLADEWIKNKVKAIEANA